MLENATHYFEENGSNISIANLPAGTCYLKIWDPSFPEASGRETNVDVKSGQKITVSIRDQMQLEKKRGNADNKTRETCRSPGTGSVPGQPISSFRE